jgi:hypothetical protein
MRPMGEGTISGEEKAAEASLPRLITYQCDHYGALVQSVRLTIRETVQILPVFLLSNVQPSSVSLCTVQLLSGMPSANTCIPSEKPLENPSDNMEAQMIAVIA